MAGTIIKLAERTEDLGGYDLIAIATHGRGGFKRLVMGSVTEHLLGETLLPLLIVRPQEAEAKGEGPGETIPVGEKAQTWAGRL